jgi:hypothetical protein
VASCQLLNAICYWLFVAGDAIVIDPEDIVVESRSNLWAFSLTPEQAQALTPRDVAAFAADVIAGRRAQLATGDHAPMIMYWYHDEQAGQLQFNIVSAKHGFLPFGCAVVLTPCIEEIADAWLRSNHGVIPWEELKPLSSSNKPDEIAPYRLPVWSVQIP